MNDSIFVRKRRTRSQNWTPQEKAILISVIRQFDINLLLEKRTDNAINMRKRREWHNINKMHCQKSGVNRTVAQILVLWRRIKDEVIKTALVGTNSKDPLVQDANEINMKDEFLDKENNLSMCCTSDFDIKRERFSPEHSDEEVRSELSSPANTDHEDNFTKEMSTTVSEDGNDYLSIPQKETFIEVNTLPSKLPQPSVSNARHSEIMNKMREESLSLRIQHQRAELHFLKVKRKLDIDILKYEKEKLKLELQKLRGTHEDESL